MRFYKRRRILQIKKYFPEAHIEKINSWKILKENMGDCEIISNGGKIHEIGEDIASKESSKTRYHQKKKAMTKSCDIESKQNIQRLLDIVEIKKNSKTKRKGITSVLVKERPDLIRERHQGIKLAKELAIEERMERFILEASNVKWRKWQQCFIEKATTHEIKSREILVVYDPLGNTGKSYLTTMFSLLYPDQTCNLQNGKSQNMFYSAGKVDDLKYVLMDLTRSDENSVNYSAIEKIKNGHFDTCKYDNENVCVKPPFFAIFTNFKLHWWALSLDRWSLLYIDKEKDTFKFFQRYNRDMKTYFNSDLNFQN